MGAPTGRGQPLGGRGTNTRGMMRGGPGPQRGSMPQGRGMRMPSRPQPRQMMNPNMIRPGMGGMSRPGMMMRGGMRGRMMGGMNMRGMRSMMNAPINMPRTGMAATSMRPGTLTPSQLQVLGAVKTAMGRSSGQQPSPQQKVMDAKSTTMQLTSEGRAGLNIDHTPNGCVITAIHDDPGQPNLKPEDWLTHINGRSLVGLAADKQLEIFIAETKRANAAGKQSVQIKIKRKKKGTSSLKQYRVNSPSGLVYYTEPNFASATESKLSGFALVRAKKVEDEWVQCENNMWLPLRKDGQDVLLGVDREIKKVLVTWDAQMKAGFQTSGAVVNTVFDSTPADRAGLKNCVGWRITHVQDMWVNTDKEIIDKLKITRRPHQNFTLTVESPQQYYPNGMLVDVALLKAGAKTGKWIPAKVKRMMSMNQYAVEVMESPYARAKKWVGNEFHIAKDNLRFQQVQLDPPMPEAKAAAELPAAGTKPSASSTSRPSVISGPISIQSIAKYSNVDLSATANYTVKDRYKCRQCARQLPQFMYSKPQQKMAKRIINHLPICLECALSSPEEIATARIGLTRCWDAEKASYYTCSVTTYGVLVEDMDEYLKSKKYEESYNEAMPKASSIEKFCKEMRANNKYYGEQFRIFPFCKFPPRSKSDLIKPLPSLHVSYVQEYCDMNGVDRLVEKLAALFKRMDSPYKFEKDHLNVFAASSLKFWTDVRYLARKYCPDFTKREFIEQLWDMEDKKSLAQREATNSSLKRYKMDTDIRRHVLEFCNFRRIEKPKRSRSRSKKKGEKRSRSRSRDRRRRERERELRRRERERRLKREMEDRKRRRDREEERERREKKRKREREKEREREKDKKRRRDRARSKSSSSSSSEKEAKPKVEEKPVDKSKKPEGITPAPWTMVFSKSKTRWYYYNEETGESKWEIPEEVKAAREKEQKEKEKEKAKEKEKKKKKKRASSESRSRSRSRKKHDVILRN